MKSISIKILGNDDISKELFIKIYIIQKKIIVLFSFCANLIIIYNISKKVKINTDNKIQFFKEDNINFSEYNTTIKAIAIYNNNLIKETEANNKFIKQLKQNIKLALSHGIYGFAFYKYWSNSINNTNSPADIIIRYKSLKIKFLIVLEKNENENLNKDFNIPDIFEMLKNYIRDERYIRFHNKSLLIVNMEELNKNNIYLLKQEFNKNNLGELFVLSNSTNYNKNLNTDGIIYSPSYNMLEKIKFHYNHTVGYFYTHLIYYNLSENIKHNNIFRMSIPMINYPIYIKKKRTYIYGDYTPEKFYFLNQVIVNYTKQRFDEDNRFIFINGFNELENNNILGYSNINSLSKALYELPFIIDNNKTLNLNNLKKNILVLVQAHVYYIDLIENIINKTNNIPVPFDLYITTNNNMKKNYIEEYLTNNSKANKYEVLITPNKGRDIIPCLIQLKDIILKYKYLCHIHTKKHIGEGQLGLLWQNYLYENLLGNKNITQKILSDFENHKTLGFIFPEHFYRLIKHAYFYKSKNCKYVHKLFKIIFPKMNIRIGDINNFPVGNMFWARTKAIYQIFDERIIKLAPKEKGQLDSTILHGIERFWLFIVKLNGYFYKTILYYI